MEQAGFLLKVLLLSAALSVLIKSGGPSVAIPTPTTVLIVVFLPTVVMAIALLGRVK